ncbi:MAG: exosome complex protein Rrp42 [Nanoarchaeota archaeon]|nr:exosome complex protein Rrp42 [Nanoarchaeota archaeon]
MSESQRAHIIGLLDAGTRLDGRKLTEYRKDITIERGFTKTAEGSARVKIGETEVLVGVKLEIGRPYPDSPDQGSIMINVELLPLSSPIFETGPPGIQAIELSRVIDRGIRESHTVDFKKLCIEEGESCWVVVIDICALNDAGNLFDAASLGAYAAMQDVFFPKVENGKPVYKEKTKDRIPLEHTPVLVNVCKIGPHLIVDPLPEEEEVVDSRLAVVSMEDGELCALQKGGDDPISLEDLDKMLDLGIEKAKVLRKFLEK